MAGLIEVRFCAFIHSENNRVIYTGCDGGNRGFRDPGKRAIQAIQTLLSHSAQVVSPSTPGREKSREGL